MRRRIRRYYAVGGQCPRRLSRFHSASRRLCRFHTASRATTRLRAAWGRPQCGFHLLPRNATRLAKPAAVRPPLIGAGQVSVIHSSPSPRETHPRRESNEESPERPLCGFHLLPRNITQPARPAAVRPPLIGAEQVFVIPECPSPRKAHPHHESNEESPGSQ